MHVREKRGRMPVHVPVVSVVVAVEEFPRAPGPTGGANEGGQTWVGCAWSDPPPTRKNHMHTEHGLDLDFPFHGAWGRGGSRLGRGAKMAGRRPPDSTSIPSGSGSK